MRIRPFEYLAPESLEEALTELRNFGSDTVLLAGGTDLILAMKH
ncbi:MAG: xanthine dehydrogenase family protein subunit M, partial [Deltaproteobacteria bacterium]